MKVVINSCFGGFGLSRKAVLRLRETGCPHFSVIPFSEWFNPDDDPEDDYFESEDMIIDHEKKTVTKECHHERMNANTGRTCEHLIRVVEELGAEANGRCGKLTIVEIPDDVHWQVEDYDGNEWIAEQHRTWR